MQAVTSISRIAAAVALASVAFASTATAATAPASGYWTEFATLASIEGWNVNSESNWYWSSSSRGVYTGVADVSGVYPNQASRLVDQAETDQAREFSFKGSVTAQGADPAVPVSIAMTVDAAGAEGNLSVFCESSLGACSIFFVGIEAVAHSATPTAASVAPAPPDFSDLDLRLVVDMTNERGTVDLYNHQVRLGSLSITDPNALADFSALFWSSPQVRISLSSSYQNSDILRLDRVSYR